MVIFCTLPFLTFARSQRAPGDEDKILSDKYDDHLLAYNRLGRSSRSKRPELATSPVADLLRSLPADIRERALALTTPSESGALPAAAEAELSGVRVSLFDAFTGAMEGVAETEAEEAKEAPRARARAATGADAEHSSSDAEEHEEVQEDEEASTGARKRSGGASSGKARTSATGGKRGGSRSNSRK
jgi:hypothetical protein